jgi:hypothetical protein
MGDRRKRWRKRTRGYGGYSGADTAENHVTLWPVDGTVFLFMGKNDLYERRVCVSYLTHVQFALHLKCGS